MNPLDEIRSLITDFWESGINIPLLKQIIGILGAALPVVLVVWGCIINHGAVEGSMSDYYAFRTRDAFVGILFVIGLILFVYKGPYKVDNRVGNMACIFAWGVALFSNTDGGWMSKVHFTCAVCLFALLAFFSIFLFTKTRYAPKKFWRAIKWILKGNATKKERKVKDRKITRNKIYIACGTIILAMLVFLGLYLWLWQDTFLSNYKLVLILEWIMVWAFAFSWLTKGNFILPDKEETKQIK
jgi:hypothetical protein